MAQPKGRPQQQQQQHVNSVATNSYAMPAAASQTGNAAAAAAPLTDSLELCQSALSQPSKPRQQQQRFLDQIGSTLKATQQQAWGVNPPKASRPHMGVSAGPVAPIAKVNGTIN